MITLNEIFKKRYQFMIASAIDLVPGVYAVNNFHIIDNEVFTKTLYLDTDTGYYKTVSRTLIASLFGGIGKILKEYFDRNEPVQIEVINQRSKSGKYGLSFYVD